LVGFEVAITSPCRCYWLGSPWCWSHLGGPLLFGLLLCFGLEALQIFPVKLLGNRAYISVFTHCLKFHLPVKLCLDTQGYMLTHVYTYVLVYAHLSTQKNPAAASVFLLAASDHRNQVIVGRIQGYCVRRHLKRQAGMLFNQCADLEGYRGWGGISQIGSHLKYPRGSLRC
jgi:hypothetical protein